MSGIGFSGLDIWLDAVFVGLWVVVAIALPDRHFAHHLSGWTANHSVSTRRVRFECPSAPSLSCAAAWQQRVHDYEGRCGRHAESRAGVLNRVFVKPFELYLVPHPSTGEIV